MNYNDTSLIYKIEYKSPSVVNKLSKYINHTLQKFDSPTNIIALCIGTDRSTGDSLGPIVGSMIEEKHKPSSESYNIEVLGTLDQPIHALNLEKNMLRLETRDPNAFVIAIDACLGNINSVGQIQVGKGSLRPGAGVNKRLPAVGKMHVTGIVNIAGFMEYFVLQNTRLNMVMKMAEIISSSILLAVDSLKKQGRQATS